MAEDFVFPIEAYKQGVDDERGRILKLLEDRLQEAALPDGALFIESMVIKQVIKLVGEDK
jgi:hypothetical protein